MGLKNVAGHRGNASKATGAEYASVDVQDLGGSNAGVGACTIAAGMKQRDR